MAKLLHGCMRMVWCLLAVTLEACGALSLPTKPGADGGFQTGFSTDAAVGAADASVVSIDAGLFTPDAGQGAEGVDAGGWRASSVSLVTTEGNSVLGIAAGAAEVYAVTDFELFRIMGGAFVNVPLATTGATLAGVYVAPDGAVFVMAQRAFFWCRTGCSAGGSAFSSFVASVTNDATAVCGASSTNVFATLHDRSGSEVNALWHFDGTVWSSVSSDLGIGSPHHCVVTDSGLAVIAGEGGIALFDQGSLSVAHPDEGFVSASEMATMHWYGVTAVGEELWVGGQYSRTAHRTSAGVWTYDDPNLAASIDYGLAATGPSEVFAVGGPAPVLHVVGSAATVPYALVEVARAIIADGPNVLYVGGNHGLKPAIDRFTR